tara:strand:- start:204 stop:572 length:369 start_codon:yes stop_codon:yes gene_type:complete
MTYKDNSLGHLEAWLNDALHSDATSKEVYDSLILTVKDEIEYHKRCLKRSQDLLVMLKGNLSALYETDNDVDKISLNDSQAYVSSKVTNAKTEQEYRDFWNPAKDDEAFEDTLRREGYEYTP